MIAWLGPAVLLVLLTTSPQQKAEAGPGAVAVVLAEEFAAVAHGHAPVRAVEPQSEDGAAVRREVRELPRCRSVREAGLPPPRAP